MGGGHSRRLLYSIAFSILYRILSCAFPLSIKLKHRVVSLPKLNGENNTILQERGWGEV